MSIFRVLVADDDEFVREDISLALKSDRFEIDTAPNGKAAFEIFKQKKHQIVITDIQMSTPEDGFELLKKIKTTSPDTAVMIITGFGDVKRAVTAMQLGAIDFVTKPLDADQIAIKVTKIAERVALEDEIIRLRNKLSSKYEIIGKSSTIEELKKQIAIVATKSDNCSVLITGPNGSGKELVAWAIKNQSGRADKPFEIINCAALPEHLIESELFGTARGAFTNAVDKKGKFEIADEGTIFLDEIGDMSLATQAKVLRVLQDGEFSRLGGEKTITVNVRVISATNKDLKELIKQKLFREDLYHRLTVVTLHTPSLKQRAEDIPVLIEHFLRQIGKKSDIFSVFDQSGLAYLKSLEWPGNVRELRNVVERCLIFWNGEPMTRDMVCSFTGGDPKNAGWAGDTGKTLKEATNVFEREYIGRVLDECIWNISVAAERLDLQRPYLHKKMKKLGIARPSQGDQE